ncbi:MAG: OmpA family protein, partial [Acidobacteria bacterium]|nr:OmpA family protein [Acidobacteriota bacterium]
KGEIMSLRAKIFTAAIGLFVIWMCLLLFRREPIELDLTNRVTSSLSEAAFIGVEVTFEGRDGALSGQVDSKEQKEKAEQIAESVWGVRVIRNKLMVPTEPVTSVKPPPEKKIEQKEESQPALHEFFETAVIEFENGSHQLSERDKQTLKTIVEMIQDDQESRIEIQGHTDNVGSSSSNLLLSENRANSVKDHLIALGVDSNRLSVKGHGDTQPVADNNTVEGRRKNRRVTFTVKQTGF